MRVVVTKSVPVTDEQGRFVCYVHPDTVRALAQRHGGAVPELVVREVLEGDKPSEGKLRNTA